MKGLITASAFAGSLSSRAMKVVQIVARCTDPLSMSTVVLLVRSTTKLFATGRGYGHANNLQLDFCSSLEPALLSRPVNIRCDRPDVPGRGHRRSIDSVGIATGDLLIRHIVLVVLEFMSCYR